jgi:carbamoyltransferase
VVARFTGRMEYGPRALGNRSILYRSDDPSVNDWLNQMLRRKEYMPFAPATLAEAAEQCYGDLEPARQCVRFMTIAVPCTDYMRRVSPGTVHVDGTARPQVVGEEDNPSYYRILRLYREKTGIPSVINTSFNMHEEPIVCTPDDACRALLASRLPYMAMNRFLVIGPGAEMPT